MIKLVHSEILKMKRSSMTLIGFAGATVTPVVTFTSYMLYRTRDPLTTPSFEALLSETSLYLVVLIGLPLYGVLATWMINREFSENTLKNILVIPVYRNAFLLSKIIVLFAWIMVLSLWSWLLAVLLGHFGGFKGSDSGLLGKYLVKFAAEGILQFFLLGPILFATLFFRNFVPVIVLTVSLTLVGILVGNSEYQALFPWTAILTVVSPAMPPRYPHWVPYVSIGATSLAGYALSFLYFHRMDIS